MDIREIAKKVSYHSHYKLIRSGDLLGWDKGTSSFLSRLFVKLICWWTRYPIGHVGIAWRRGDDLWVFEATLPFVRLLPVRHTEDFFHIPASVSWRDEDEAFLYKIIGFVYSMMDCIRAGLGITTKRDDNYQCAEVCIDFYTQTGLEVRCRQTPKGMAQWMLEENGQVIYHVQPSE